MGTTRFGRRDANGSPGASHATGSGDVTASSQSSPQHPPKSTRMPQRGSFIVIEGLDRSGKTTQCQILYETLQRELGVDKVNLIKFPGTSWLPSIQKSVDRTDIVDRTTPIGKMIDSYLRSTSDLDDRAIHLLFSANRWEASCVMDTARRQCHFNSFGI